MAHEAGAADASTQDAASDAADDVVNTNDASHEGGTVDGSLDDGGGTSDGAGDGDVTNATTTCNDASSANECSSPLDGSNDGP